MTTSLVAAIPDETVITVSRLLDPDIREEITATGRTVVETPHIGCDPVLRPLDTPAIRLRCWPNIGGCLERGAAEDLVVWDPSLALQPDRGIVLPTASEPGPRIIDRTHFLRLLLRRLRQLKGVVEACPPQAPRTIIYTPGFDPLDLTDITDRYPGSLTPTPARLAEFPGGLRITITDDVMDADVAFTRDIVSLVGR